MINKKIVMIQEKISRSISDDLDAIRELNNCQGPISCVSLGPCAMAQWHIGQSEPVPVVWSCSKMNEPPKKLDANSDLRPS